jgi:DNA-binding response OmpR family regulator
MPKVLVIDDDPELRALMTTFLTAKGFEVSSAKNGAEGLAQAQADQPDLIALDLIMPGMDGFAVLQQLREDPVFRDVPIMVLSAMTTSDAHNKAIDAGVRTFVAKPFDYREIVFKIRTLIASNNLFTAKTMPANGSGRARNLSAPSAGQP